MIKEDIETLKKWAAWRLDPSTFNTTEEDADAARAVMNLVSLVGTLEARLADKTDAIAAINASHERYRELVRSDLAEKTWTQECARLRAKLSEILNVRAAIVYGLTSAIRRHDTDGDVKTGCERALTVVGDLTLGGA